MKSFPFSKGDPCLGMPSSCTHFTNGSPWPESGRSTSPGLEVTNSFRPSRCVTRNEYPQSASCSVTSLRISRSLCLRVKTLCSFSCSTNKMSPGSALGTSSDMPRNRIFSSFFIPRSMFTSSTLRSFSFFMENPVAPQVAHCCWICCTIPGPICRMRTITPRPLHSLHCSGLPTILSLDTASFAVLPLYKSSKLTLRGCLTSGPFLGPGGARPPPPPRLRPPKSAEKMSSAPSGMSPPSSASSPPLSYLARFSSSFSTS
mmetsp:Transcript_63190/g.126847  ORF Transcript_63190/g.126847 Transcript_63190/m.126847 type:complete len:259 (+) Transcript_63190:588-1364(+)